MTGKADPDTRVYYCLVCGPCLREIHDIGGEIGTVTLHLNIPHPYDTSFDEEDSPQ